MAIAVGQHPTETGQEEVLGIFVTHEYEGEDMERISRFDMLSILL